MHLFFQAIQHLRQREELMLYGHLLQIEPEDSQQTALFLEVEYARETLDYPHAPPDFRPDAALWAAQTLYFGAQLLLYREHDLSDLPALFPDFSGAMTAGAALSADLCLRFVPALIRQLRALDPEDPLADLLEEKLYAWPYSALRHPLAAERLSLELIESNPCLRQLYQDRFH